MDAALRLLVALAPAPPAALSTELPGARDARLVALARADADEFVHLVKLHERRVFATALRITGNAADADEITQEAFLRAYKNLHRFELGRPFAPWVCVIAANLARDRRRGPLRRFLPFGLGRDAEEAAPPRPDPVAARERASTVEEALATLSPALREAIVLRFVSELSVEEVARALDIGESAAKMRLKRGLAELRATLGEEMPLPDEE